MNEPAKKKPNILLFQLLVCEDLLFFFVLYHWELNIFGFWTVGWIKQHLITTDFWIEIMASFSLKHWRHWRWIHTPDSVCGCVYLYLHTLVLIKCVYMCTSIFELKKLAWINVCKALNGQYRDFCTGLCYTQQSLFSLLLCQAHAHKHLHQSAYIDRGTLSSSYITSLWSQIWKKAMKEKKTAEKVQFSTLALIKWEIPQCKIARSQ